MKQKGAVPIPYIIALLLGIAVVAIIGYWFFVLGGQWGGETTLQDCRTRAYTYCAAWQALGYTPDNEDTPTEPSPGWFGDLYPACRAHEDTIGFSGGTEDLPGDIETDEDVCKDILGI